ncbi:NAD(P)-binding domain-containing protein [Halovenus sp. WSH3]|uniref:NAD(P)-binding domain-containing protein n=1 Tax=Halovenus carboxidivorans TaxID=2692199 RepID=A0A6B0TI97_9EURY|nr:NAD(P)/FAD-dependent oxidoreductase [Halovenus carboxidivorans]MXR52929.1 NAD(P)-binding domain-containing protein [Halovenus carboxidivorans]
MSSQTEHSGGTVYETDYDAVIVGAGFSGLYQLHRLRDEFGLSVKVIEKADDVGGTWYWNRYPGAQCDSESHVYCYSFNEEILEEWQWSERYPSQPEVLEYLRFVADRLDLRKDIEFGTEVTSASFDESDGQWRIGTDDGEELTSQFFVTAVGCLSEPWVPDFDHIDSFEGEAYHTGRWPHDGVDFAGKRIAVIGTGASGIQVIPEVAEEDIDHLTVFQRTPNYAVPARDRPLEDDDWDEIQKNYDEILQTAHENGFGMPFDPAYPTAEDKSMEEVREILEPRWQEGGFRFMLTFEDLVFNPETNEKVSQFVREKIRETVDDPELAEKLVPKDHYYATKRPPLHTNYYETFNEDHVSLVDVTETPIERMTPEGIQTSDDHHEFDMIIYATGFDAMTGTLLNMDIRGRDDLTLEEKWADGPQTYLGLAVHGFPNMFTITGPQSPSVLSNMPVSIEHHVEWVSDAINHFAENDIRLVEPTREAEEAWTAHNTEVAEQTLYPTADSWYMNENIEDKPTVFTPYIGGVDVYHQTIQEVAQKGYEGFELTESISDLDPKGDQPSLSVMEGD